jgi:glycosyltransferase involved in cell wall biosynthesis
VKGPLVSVIVPVYNGERFLAEALDSVCAQGYSPLEVIVVDDGSTDQTAKVVDKFKDKVVYFFQQNSGPAAARNKGIASARGAFIAFLDADDLWAPNKVERQVDYLLQHPETGCVFTHQRIVIEPGTEWPHWLREEFLQNDHIGYIPSSLIVRRPVFGQLGNFDPSYRTAEDYDWFFRAKEAGITMAVLPETLLHKRIHDSNLTRQVKMIHIKLVHAVKSSLARRRDKGPIKDNQQNNGETVGNGF